MTTDRRELRSTWRPALTAVRVDDRWVNWMAFSPVVVAAAWIVLVSFGILSGAGSSPDAFAAPAVGLLAFDAFTALQDRAGLGRSGLRPLPSVLWCFATPFVYLPIRRRALLSARLTESWAPFAIHCALLTPIVLLCTGWIVLSRLAGG